MERTEFLILAEKVAYGRASQEELFLYNACLEDLLQQYKAKEDDAITSHEQTELWQNIQFHIELKPSQNWFQKSYKFAAAAIVVLILSAGLYFSNDNKEKVQQKQLTEVIKPGGNKAILTLADGKKITLNDDQNEKIILAERHSSVRVKKNGELVYDQSTETNSEAPQYHKIETPIGGRYQLSLPDGSKITLNSASSLRYPVVFVGKERVVELSGEGYFEVSKDASKPFKVNAGKQQVQVVGTQFNINSYPEEGKISTTLVEGSVKVGLKNFKLDRLLKPGQQSVLTGSDFVVSTVDTEEFIAWKDGYFYFKKEHISTAMNKLAKWYNVEIVYRGHFNDIFFSGSFGRSTPLASVLKILELTNKLKFNVQGRRIIVMN